MSIRLLPPQVANQIAAGEVVERPSAVVKELVENAFDAGATKVQVEIEQGGAKLILVRDNGKGIEEEELPLALKRHATSKLSSIEDLDSLSSMGFRGEALASVAAVSRLTLTSRTANESVGHTIKVEGVGQVPVVEPAPHPIGTTVEVADLFFNTPARRRFMRSEKSEFLQIEEMFRRLALSRPECILSLKHNGRLIYDFKAEANISRPNKRMAKIFGAEFVAKACSIDVQAKDMSLQGFCSILECVKPVQYFFVNGRIVKDKVILRAVSDAYEEVIGRKVSDSYICFLKMPQALVDINVHPQKYEVRFQEPRLVHDFITGGFVNALRNSTQLFKEEFSETANVPLAHNYCDVAKLNVTEDNASKFSEVLEQEGEILLGGSVFKPTPPSSVESSFDGLPLGQGDTTTCQYQKTIEQPNFNYQIRRNVTHTSHLNQVGNNTQRDIIEQKEKVEATNSYYAKVFGKNSTSHQNQNVFADNKFIAEHEPFEVTKNPDACLCDPLNVHNVPDSIGTFDEEKESDGLPPLEVQAFFAPWLVPASVNINSTFKLCQVTAKHYAVVSYKERVYLWDLLKCSRELYWRHLQHNKSSLLVTSQLIVPISIKVAKDGAIYCRILEMLGFACVPSNNSCIQFNGVPLVMRCMNIAKIVDELLTKLREDMGEIEILSIFSNVLCDVKIPLYFTTAMATSLLQQVEASFNIEECNFVKEVKFEPIIKELFCE